MDRRIGTDDDLAHARMDAVGADHGIGRHLGAIGKGQRHAAIGLIEPDQLLAEMDDSRRQHRIKRVMQIGAMHAQERRAVQAFRHRQFALDLAGVPDAVEMGIRLKGGLAQFFLDADSPQHTRRIRQHLDAGADARELRRLFVDVDLDARARERRGGRQAPHARSDDRDGWFAFCHGLPSLSLFSLHKRLSAVERDVNAAEFNRCRRHGGHRTGRDFHKDQTFNFPARR